MGKKTGTYANTKSAEGAMKIFKFGSDHSNVEWGLIGSKDGEYTLGNVHENSTVGGLLKVSGFTLDDLSFDYHSHPGGPSKIGDFASDGIGDQGFASKQITKLLAKDVPYSKLPKYYIYRPHVDKPYRFEYDPWTRKKDPIRVKSWRNL